MSTKQNSTNPSDVVISWLKGEKNERVQRNFLPSECVIIDRWLDRELELKSTFEELSDKLSPLQWQIYLGVIFNTSAFWNPDEAQKMRDASKRLFKINERVSKISRELTSLLDERTKISNDYCFDSDDAYHIVDLIKRANHDNYLYESHLHPKLSPLTSQYDSKYWPSVSKIVAEIGYDADSSIVVPIQEITREAISSRRSSTRDYLRALFVATDEIVGNTFRDIPKTFNLRDESFASLINCSLDLVDDDMVDGAYVKGCRNDFRSQQSNKERENHH